MSGMRDARKKKNEKIQEKEEERRNGERRDKNSELERTRGKQMEA